MNLLVSFIPILCSLAMLSMIFIPKNGIIGLRCYWSMYSDDVWKNANVAAGYVLAVCCCSTASNVLFGGIGIHSFVFALIVASLLSVAYSYAVYRVKIGAGAGGKTVLSNRFADILLFAVAVVSVLLCLGLFYTQATEFEHCGNNVIAVHFNAENQADGFASAPEFLAYFEKVQLYGIGCCVLISLIAVYFTKNVFGGTTSKAAVAFAAAGMSSLAIVCYNTGIILSVAQANASAKTGNPTLDIFSEPSLHYLVLSALISVVTIPLTLYFKAYVNCRRYLSEYKS